MQLPTDLVFTETSFQESFIRFLRTTDRLRLALTDYIDTVTQGVPTLSSPKIMEKMVEYEHIYEERRKLAEGVENVVLVDFGDLIGLKTEAKVGEYGRTESVDIDRVIRFYRGVTAIIDASPAILEQAKKMRYVKGGPFGRFGYEFRNPDKLIVRAGDWYEWEVRHDNYALTFFLASDYPPINEQPT